jgi:hypothetical protein
MRIAVPAAIVAIILLISVVLRWVLAKAIPDDIGHTIAGNIVLSLVAILAASTIVYLVGRLAVLSNSSRLAAAMAPPPARSSSESAAPPRRKEMVGTPANGVLTLQRLSQDPKTKQNLDELRERVQKRS